MTLLIPIALFVLGAMLGAGANFLIFRERLEPRPISPWMSSELRASPRRLLDFVPIFGWLGMRRYAKTFGAGFWIRPLLVELIAAIGTVALYDYEIGGGLLPANFPRPIAGDVFDDIASAIRFASRAFVFHAYGLADRCGRNDHSRLDHDPRHTFGLGVGGHFSPFAVARLLFGSILRLAQGSAPYRLARIVAGIA